MGSGGECGIQESEGREDASMTPLPLARARLMARETETPISPALTPVFMLKYRLN